MNTTATEIMISNGVINFFDFNEQIDREWLGAIILIQSIDSARKDIIIYVTVNDNEQKKVKKIQFTVLADNIYKN